MSRLSMVLPIALLWGGAAHAQQDAARLIGECDRLAASDLDLARPASVPGVPVQAIDAKAATAACLAAAKAAPDNPRLLLQLGRALQVDKKDENARKAYELAAAAGYALAIYNHGVMFEHGTGGSRDVAQARALYEKAAAAGSPLAMRGLAHGYENGLGVEKNPALALTWHARSLPGFEQLAARGSPLAMFQTGWIYHLGKGVPKDVAKGRFWYEKAAAAGFPQAMTNLGGLYADGDGVPRDLGLAQLWYERAAQAGDKTGAANLQRLRPAAATPAAVAQPPAPAGTPPVASPPLAQAAPAPQPAPPTPTAPRDKPAIDAVPPERVMRDIEASAQRQQGKSFNYGRWGNFRTSASDRAFDAALGNHAVMLVTILVQKPEQLPVGGLYLRANGRDTAIVRLSSWRSQIDGNLAAAKIYGPYREDGFYLIPVTSMLREGVLMFNLANQPSVGLFQYPSVALQGRPDPGPPRAVDPAGVRGFIARLFPGFPVPAAMP